MPTALDLQEAKLPNTLNFLKIESPNIQFAQHNAHKLPFKEQYKISTWIRKITSGPHIKIQNHHISPHKHKKITLIPKKSIEILQLNYYKKLNKTTNSYRFISHGISLPSDPSRRTHIWVLIILGLTLKSNMS